MQPLGKAAVRLGLIGSKNSERLRSGADHTPAQTHRTYTPNLYFHSQSNDDKALHAERHNSPAVSFDWQGCRSRQLRRDWRFEIPRYAPSASNTFLGVRVSLVEKSTNRSPLYLENSIAEVFREYPRCRPLHPPFLAEVRRSLHLE